MPVNAKQNNTRLFLFSFALFQTENCLGWMEKLETELNQGQRFSDENFFQVKCFIRGESKQAKGKRKYVKMCKGEKNSTLSSSDSQYTFHSQSHTNALCIGAVTARGGQLQQLSENDLIMTTSQNVSVTSAIFEILYYKGAFNRLKTFTQEKE